MRNRLMCISNDATQDNGWVLACADTGSLALQGSVSTKSQVDLIGLGCGPGTRLSAVQNWAQFSPGFLGRAQPRGIIAGELTPPLSSCSAGPCSLCELPQGDEHERSGPTTEIFSTVMWIFPTTSLTTFDRWETWPWDHKSRSDVSAPHLMQH